MFEMLTEYHVESKRNSLIAPLLADVVRSQVAQERSKRFQLEDRARRHALAQVPYKAIVAVFAVITRRNLTNSTAK